MDIIQLAQAARNLRDELVILIDEASVLRDASAQIALLQRQETALRAAIANLQAQEATAQNKLDAVKAQLQTKIDLLRQVEALIRG